MPSPFPGMDPYLERPDVFPGLHNRLIAVLSEQLQSLLPPPYFAEFGERVWVEVSDRYIEPDVSVLAQPGSKVAAPQAGGEVRGRMVVVTVPREERRESFVEIRTSGDRGEFLVAAIEVLSPSNKTPGAQSRDLYLRKQRELIDGGVHLVEIDLLRGGKHATAVPPKRLHEAAGLFNYHVSIHRADRFEDFFVYPVRLDETLPQISIPLLPNDPEIAVDLQSVFDRAYDTGPYRRRIKYQSETPIPPLRPDQQAWVEARLRDAPANG